MSKGKVILAACFLLVLLFICSTFWHELEPDFSAIDYLEGKGYSSVRILGQLAEGHGCKPDDTYRFTFDAIPFDGNRRVEGRVCGGGTAIWYEEK